jgi:integrase
LKKGESRIVDAVLVLLYTGQRESDVVNMVRDDVSAGRIRVVQEKTSKHLWIPLHPVLRGHFAQRKITGLGPLLVNSRGQAWTADGLRTALFDARVDLGLEDHKPHGLRKNAVCALLEAGCTVNETAAVTGQTPQMVEHYAREVNQVKLAEQAMAKWADAQGRRGIWITS